MNIYRDEYTLDRELRKINRNSNKIETLQQVWTPNNFMKSKGACIEDTLYPSEWLYPADGLTCLGRDTSKKLFESGSIMFSLLPNKWKTITKGINYDFTNVDTIGIALYIEDQFALDTVELRIATTASYINNTNTWSKYFSKNVGNTGTNLHSGWNFIKLHKDDFTNVGTETWGVFRAIRLVLAVGTNKFDNSFSIKNGATITSSVVGIGGIYLNPTYETPKLLLSFDDSCTPMFTNGFPYMRQKGIKSTLFLCTDHTRENSTGNGYMTKQQHQEWYDSGNDIGTHSVTHQSFYPLTKEQLYEELAPPIQYLLQNGWTRGAYTLAFPMGQYNSIALNVIKDLGVKIARGRNKGYIHHATSDDILDIPSFEITGSTTLADITGWIDKAIALNSSLGIFTHYMVESNPDAYSTTITNFNAFIDYIATKRDLGLLDILTYSQFYDRLSDKTATIPSIITT